MPIATRTAHALAAACLAIVMLVVVFPGPAAALQPPRPLPGYRAHFVTQTDRRPMTNCLWASASMLLDKWTNGDVRIHHQKLRRMSGDLRGGSAFDELAVTFEKLGFDLEYSPDGGARITFGQMLARLRKGAGAIVLGDYHDLPRYYGRWDRKFWKKKGKKDNHAVYVERYDRARGRVWLMDPLARGDWKGEWISIWALRRFAWSRGGYMYVAMTPTAKVAPFAKVKVSKPKVVRTATAIDAAWTLKVPRKWRFPGADAKVAFKPAEDALLAAALSSALPTATTAAEDALLAAASSSAPPTAAKDDPAPKEASVAASGKRMHLTAPLPVEPGAYVGSLQVRDRRFGRVVAEADRLAVFIPGDRRASLHLTVRGSKVEAGAPVRVTVNVANSGVDSWADGRAPGSGQEGTARATRVEAHWIPLEVPDDENGDAVPAVAPALLKLVALARGRATMVRASVMAPGRPGRWALVVDVADDIAGSFAALGSAPAVATIEVVEARGIERVE